MKKYLDLLNQDKLRNISIINFIENNPIDSIEEVAKSLIVRGRSDRDWVYIMCNNQEELNVVKSKLTDQDKCFGAIEEWMIPTLVKGEEILWNLSFKQFYLSDKVSLPKSEHEVKDLTEKDAETIYKNSDYKDFISVEYVTERINNGPGKGMFENEELVAWGLTQDDGALGFLHVMENKRKKGYGLGITTALIEEVRSEGKIPFAYIEHDNFKSINLCQKLGFHWQKNCQWFELK